MRVYPGGKRPFAGGRQQAQHLGQPLGPGVGFGRADGACPSQQILGRGKRRAAGAQFQFQIARGFQMRPAVCRARCRQRMLEQRKHRVDRQFLPEQTRNLPQKPPRWGLLQRHAGAVIGHDPPAVQRRRHPPRERAVRRDQRGARAVFRRLAQRQRDRYGFLPRVGRLDQRKAPRRGGQIAQSCALGHPLVSHRRGAQRQ